MAIIRCRECGSDVSSQAKTCPKCGCPVPTDPSTLKTAQETRDRETKGKNTYAAISAVVLMLAVIMWLIQCNL